ncbi:MAG: hypothetical protein Aureis2KO_19020 [Aureisphaera sp.]
MIHLNYKSYNRGLIIFFLFITIFATHNSYSQNEYYQVPPPSPGKAVVYFVIPVGYKPTQTFDFFEKGQFIGSIIGPNYLRYECDPGKNLFWLATRDFNEVIDFIEADLKADVIYVLENYTPNNMWSDSNGFYLMDEEDDRQMARIFATVAHAKGSEPSQNYLNEIQKKQQNYINESIRVIQKRRISRNKRKKFKFLSEPFEFPLLEVPPRH